MIWIEVQNVYQLFLEELSKKSFFHQIFRKIAKYCKLWVHCWHSREPRAQMVFFETSRTSYLATAWSIFNAESFSRPSSTSCARLKHSWRSIRSLRPTSEGEKLARGRGGGAPPPPGWLFSNLMASYLDTPIFLLSNNCFWWHRDSSCIDHPWIQR